jgi:nucleotide-binding universal stress UspA family protein
MQTIVVPLDGSPLARAALPYAATLARATGSRLLLVRAVLSFARLGQDPDVVRAEALGEARAQLEALARELRADGLAAEARVLWAEAVTTILEVARQVDATLIAMSTHGRGGVGRWLFGSVADGVLRRAEQPVLLVPPRCEAHWARDRRLRILVPLDRSAFAEQALGPAEAMARALNGELQLFHVVVPPPSVYSLSPGAYPHGPTMFFAPETELAAARRYLGEVAARLSRSGLPVEWSTQVGEAATTIADAARGLGCDLIAMATHGRGGLERLVLGSVATGALQHARVPVLLVRPTALARSPTAPSASGTTDVPAGDLASRAVVVPLSRAELGHVRYGLELALHAAAPDVEAADEVRALLVRLREGTGGIDPEGSSRLPRHEGATVTAP